VPVGVWDLGFGIWDLLPRGRAYDSRVQVMTTSPDRWATVERLYHAALTRPIEERAAYLAEACAGDEGLRREIESLVAQGASAEGLLTGAAAAAAAGLVTDVGQSVLTGRRLGAYQILARAFTAEAGRLARFEREARVLASLNHPHIAAIATSLRNVAERSNAFCTAATPTYIRRG